MALALLHLSDQLPSRHLYFLFFDLLPALFHFLYLLLVPGLFHLGLLPLLVSNLSMHLHGLLLLLDLHLVVLLLLLLDLLLDLLLPLLDQTQLEPLLKRVVALLLPCDLVQPLLLLLLQLLLAFQSLLNNLLLLPVVHPFGPLLVNLVLLSLPLKQLFVQIPFGLVDQHFPQRLLVLLAPNPLLVRYLLPLSPCLLDERLVLVVDHVFVAFLNICEPDSGLVLNVSCFVKSV